MSNINLLDNHMDVLAKFGYLFGEVLNASVDNIPDNTTAFYYYQLQNQVAEVWEANKPAIYSYYSEFAED